jgi:hypothetical protein
MADRKISDLTALTAPAAGDYLPIVDISEASAANKNKRITIEELLRGAPDGTAAAPGFAFESDGGNGMYLAGTDTVAISTNGTGRLFVDANGRVGVGTGSPTTTLDCRGVISTNDALYCYNSARDGLGIWYNPGGAGVNQLTARVNGGDRLTIDSSGRLLVGTSSARTDYFNNSLTAMLQVEGTNASGAADRACVSIVNNNNLTALESPVLILGRSNGSTVNSKTIVGNGTRCGYITFQGADGSDLIDAASIAGEIDGTPGANDMPGRLVFSTTADGASSPTARMIIKSDGTVGIGTESPAGKCVVRVSDATGDETAWNSNYLLVSGGDGATAHALALGVNTSGNYSSISSLAAGTAWKSLKYKAIDHIFEGAASVERARIDSSGRLLVGTSSARANFFNTVATTSIQAEGTTYQTASLGLVSTGSNSYDAGTIVLGKGRGGSIGSNTIVQSGDITGYISFQGNDGSEFVETAYIKSEVDGTPGSDDMPGRLVFSTTADAASSPTERMRITSGGSIRLGSVSAYNSEFLTINNGAGTATEITAFGGSGGVNHRFYFNTGTAGNAAGTVYWTNADSTTGRSINAGGTINASGADYAEYMAKAGDFTIAKGDICGVTADGLLTDDYADSISFVVKSTNPSYVGSDTWGTESIVGAKPGEDEPELLAEWEARLEAERQKVDRIAFAGQVPVNVTEATPGQYIVPVTTEEGGITGVAKDEADLTLPEYMRAVGKVIAIEDDGRARIIVKVA